MVGENTHLSRFGGYVDLNSISAGKVSADISCNEVGVFKGPLILRTYTSVDL